MTKREIIKDFKLFREYCIDLRRAYNTYTALFASDQGNIDLIRKIAPVFFKEIQDMMIRDWYLRCNILMDPATTTIKKIIYKNLTVDHINIQLDQLGFLDKQIKNTAKSLLKYKKHTQKPRNKLIGHLDQASIRRGKTLGKHKSEALSAFLKDIQEYCDLVGVKIGIGPLDFSCSSCQGDVVDLLGTLRKYQKKCLT
ncbi:MAG: hypothetical protein IT395_03015 [Candidatus Omnitrophica bacterium]|nr:hypothetical protein [Candidatus Omnitrophota bacterium]